MTSSALNRRQANPRVLLAYPPLQFAPEETARPDSSLGIPYLHAAARRAGYDVDILDMSIGRPGRDSLRETFYRRQQLDGLGQGLARVGMTTERILEEVQPYSVIGITSIFTQQTSPCLEVARAIRREYPDKLLIAGGVNARSLRRVFFDAGFDVIFGSEAEGSLVTFMGWLSRRQPDALSDVPGIYWRSGDRERGTPAPPAVRDLDQLPPPSWYALPNESYWEIGEPWGGKAGWLEGQSPRFAPMITSRGCPFRCSYCHISKEQRGDEAGFLGRLRLHSLERVEMELEILRGLGVDLIYVNDDSFLAIRNRVLGILRIMQEHSFTVADVNGVNIRHLFLRDGDGDYRVDRELLEEMYDAGFRRIGLPFESGSQRLIDRYSTSKWSLEEHDVLELVSVMADMGFTINGNFLVGYPDESLTELTETFILARNVIEAGMQACGFFVVQPFPGTALFEEAVADGQLDIDDLWDVMTWTKVRSTSPYRELSVDKALLNYSRNLAHYLLNGEESLSDEWMAAFVQQ